MTKEIDWTRADATINKAARDHANDEISAYEFLHIPHDNLYGELVGSFEEGVRWAMKHYRMLGFTRKK